jgi:hypothetical protein
MKRFRWLYLLLFLVLLPGRVFAGAQYSLPHTFSAGTDAKSSEVNANFNQIISNHTPAGMDDAAEDAAAHVVTKDPTGALPTNLEEEIHEQRFKHAETNPNGSDWTDPYVGFGYGYANLAPNSGFELWSNGITSAPNGWSLEGGVIVSRDTGAANGYRDIWAIEITSAGVTSNGISHTFENLKASTTYSVVVRAKVTAGDTFKISTSGASSELSETTDSQTWSTVSGAFTTDGTPTDVVLTLGSDTSGDIVYADSLMVVEGAMPSAYARHTTDVPFTHPTFSGLVVENSIVTTTEKSDETIDITADYLVAVNEISDRILLQNVSETCDITTFGVANGLDNGTISSNASYSVWIIYNPTTFVVDSLVSSSFTAPILPSGYTYKKLVSLISIDSSVDIIDYKQFNDRLLYDAPEDDTKTVVGLVSTNFTDFDATQWTGSNVICNIVFLGWNAATASPTESDMLVRQNNSNATNGMILGKVDNDTHKKASGEISIRMDSNQILEFKRTHATATLDITINGCTLNL